MLDVSSLEPLLAGHLLTIDLALNNKPSSDGYRAIIDEIATQVAAVRPIERLRTSRFNAPVKRPSFRLDLDGGPLSATYDGPAERGAIVAFLTTCLEANHGSIRDRRDGAFTPPR